MTHAYTPDPSVLLLPKLKPESDVRAGRVPGEWTPHNSRTFQDVAESLDYQAAGEVQNVSSVPTMWARPLLMEMAIYNPGHPIRESMISQWQGMLAAIAFAEVHAYKLTVQLLQLDQYTYHPFASALERLLPAPSHALYNRNPEGRSHPWKDLYIFFWNQKPVGMTTPSTLVVPSEEGDWSGLRWWQRGTLQSPHPHLTDFEKQQLWLWLENLQRMILDPRHRGDHSSINTMITLLDDFKATLLSSPPRLELLLVDDSEFFGEPLTRGPLEALNYPLKAPERPSSVRLVSSDGMSPQKPLLILDPAVADKWGELPQNIYVHNGKTLASLDLDNLLPTTPGWGDVEWRRPENLFLPELTYIENEDNAFPGVQMPGGSEGLTLNGKPIAPLIPIDPILLNYLSAEELSQRIQFKAVNGNERQVEVILDLPLSGSSSELPINPRTARGNNAIPKPKNHRISQIYTLKREHALDGLPVLEIWPNFKAPGWQHYYLYYFDAGFKSDTFQLRVPHSRKSHEHRDTQGSIHQWMQLDNFPNSLECCRKNGDVLGIFCLQSPISVEPNTSWRVGVDFGTSFTNVYVSGGRTATCLRLDSLHCRVTNSSSDIRQTDLLDHFIPAEFFPLDTPMPLSSVLTTKGSSGSPSQLEAILDGRIYVPRLLSFYPDDGIEIDLKWKNYRANRAFLSHLILHISALAVSQGVREIHWALSYPSAFSVQDRNGYAKSWNQIISEIQPRVGIQYNLSDSPTNSNHFQTESVAIAQYAMEEERFPLSASTCIDMGGGTSDISIWEQNRLVHQCSVQLAGKHLISKLLERNPNVITRRLDRNGNWSRLRDGRFHAKLDVWLRFASKKWLDEQRANLNDAEDVQGLIQLTAIGIAGLYYYVGLILKALYQEGKYSRQEITPVFIGGNGSRLLHWLDSTGRFTSHSEVNALLSYMMSAGSGFKPIPVETRCSQHPKHEVAWGLVLDRHTVLEDYDRDPYTDPLIAGEVFQVNGQNLSWDTRMDMNAIVGDNDDVETFEIPRSFEQLPQFLYAFHQVLRDRRIESIRPLANYNRSPDIAANSALWQGTYRSLEALLNESNLTGQSIDIREEPPFILGLKALLDYLSQQWAHQSGGS
jgi:hypothetical protein